MSVTQLINPSKRIMEIFQGSLGQRTFLTPKAMDMQQGAKEAMEKDAVHQALHGAFLNKPPSLFVKYMGEDVGALRHSAMVFALTRTDVEEIMTLIEEIQKVANVRLVKKHEPR